MFGKVGIRNAAKVITNPNRRTKRIEIWFPARCPTLSTLCGSGRVGSCSSLFLTIVGEATRAPGWRQSGSCDIGKLRKTLTIVRLWVKSTPCGFIAPMDSIGHGQPFPGEGLCRLKATFSRSMARQMPVPYFRDGGSGGGRTALDAGRLLTPSAETLSPLAFGSRNRSQSWSSCL
jgi:hypothetical protein